MYVCDNHFLKAANSLEATFIFEKKLYVNVGSNLRMYLYNVCWTECLWGSWEQQYKFFSYKMLLKIFAKYSSCLSKPCFLYCVVNRDQSLLLGTGTRAGTTCAYRAQIHTTDRLQGSTHCLQRDGRCKKECGALKYQIALSQTNASRNCLVFILQCEINTF